LLRTLRLGKDQCYMFKPVLWSHVVTEHNKTSNNYSQCISITEHLYKQKHQCYIAPYLADLLMIPRQSTDPAQGHHQHENDINEKCSHPSALFSLAI